MNAAVLNTTNSRMYLIVPVRGWFDGDSPADQPNPALAVPTKPGLSFKDIDPDVHVPAWFFETLRRRDIEQPGERVHLDEDALGIQVGEAQVVGVGTGDNEAWFAVVDLADRDADLEQWLEVARQATKAEWTERICDHFGLKATHGDVRSQIVVSLHLRDRPSDDDLVDVARHLATRAPFQEKLQRSEELGEQKVGEGRYRVVTRRAAGFVASNPDQSTFFDEKFPKELDNQYVLAVVLANWQLSQLSDILDDANSMWDDEPDGRLPWLFRGSRVARHNFETLTDLRARHARLTASGTLGPVFDSGSQGQFWDELQSAMSVHRRLGEVDQMLQSAALTVETQASMNLERLLAFFTLVIGVPSLAFTVLGVNIDRLTSDSGLSTAWVIAMLIATCAIGLAAFYIANGGVRRKARRAQRPRPGSSAPSASYPAP